MGVGREKQRGIPTGLESGDMRTRLRAIAPKKAPVDAARINRAIEGALDDAAKEVKAELEKTVASWDTVVRFTIYARTGERFIGTDNIFFRWVNDGTKPHTIGPIVPKLKQALTIKAGGAPKTRAGVIGSGPGNPGSVVGIVRRVKAFRHPGTKPRKFTKTIGAKWKRLLPKLIEASIKREL